MVVSMQRWPSAFDGKRPAEQRGQGSEQQGKASSDDGHKGLFGLLQCQWASNSSIADISNITMRRSLPRTLALRHRRTELSITCVTSRLLTDTLTANPPTKPRCTVPSPQT